ncbi:MAG: hypothetical protein JXA77_16930 [Bacteroidales bacterium]|nr:hypothetical protein [Bacteroidales bacterium]MBN2819386.1 hypothetical protein [Bacteroidales bacterium]
MKKTTCITVLLLFIGGCNIILSGQENLEAFARNIEQSLQNKNTFYFTNNFDYSKFYQQIILWENSLNEFTTNSHSKNMLAVDAGSLIGNELGETGKIDFIGIKTGASDTVLVYRLLTLTGISYHEYYVSKKMDGYSIYNIYFYNKFSYLSEQCVNQANNRSRLTTNAAKINRLIQKDRYRKALNIYDRLSAKEKTVKDILLLAIKASSYSNQDKTTELINLYKSVYGEDNRIYLLPIEGSFTTSAYASTMKYMSLLETEITNDPFLNFYKGSVMKESGSYNRAEWCFNELIDKMPEMQTGYFSLLKLYIENNQFDSAVNQLSAIEQIFGYYKESLSRYLNNYNSFLESQEFTAWLQE